MSHSHEDLYQFVQQLVDQQKARLYRLALGIIPNVTQDDILQPNDFPELENHPSFRYEEGVLEGLLTMQTALFAYFTHLTQKNE